MISQGRRGLVEANHEATARSAAPLWRLVLRRVNAIVPFKEDGGGPIFYGIHSISGEVTPLQDLALRLDPEQRFYGVQVPREKMTSAFAVSIEAVARHHVEALVAFQPEGPVVLGGWSTGAIIALEMAQQLRAIGRDVPLLVAFDGAPCNTGAGISRWNPRYSWRQLRNLPRWAKEDQRQKWSWRAFARRVSERLAFRVLVAVPTVGYEQTLHSGMVRDLLSNSGWSSDQLSFIRALYEAQRRYVPMPYEGRVVLYEAQTQPLFHLLQLGAAWKKIAKRSEIVSLDGAHGGIFLEPAIGLIAGDLRTRLEELRRPERSLGQI
jgi:thioesterase domain-containing protein